MASKHNVVSKTQQNINETDKKQILSKRNVRQREKKLCNRRILTDLIEELVGKTEVIENCNGSWNKKCTKYKYFGTLEKKNFLTHTLTSETTTKLEDKRIKSLAIIILYIL